MVISKLNIFFCITTTEVWFTRLSRITSERCTRWKLRSQRRLQQCLTLCWRRTKSTFWYRWFFMARFENLKIFKINSFVYFQFMRHRWLSFQSTHRRLSTVCSSPWAPSTMKSAQSLWPTSRRRSSWCLPSTEMCSSGTTTGAWPNRSRSRFTRRSAKSWRRPSSPSLWMTWRTEFSCPALWKRRNLFSWWYLDLIFHFLMPRFLNTFFYLSLDWRRRDLRQHQSKGRHGALLRQPGQIRHHHYCGTSPERGKVHLNGQSKSVCNYILVLFRWTFALSWTSRCKRWRKRFALTRSTWRRRPELKWMTRTAEGVRPLQPWDKVRRPRFLLFLCDPHHPLLHLIMCWLLTRHLFFLLNVTPVVNQGENIGLEIHRNKCCSGNEWKVFH